MGLTWKKPEMYVLGDIKGQIHGMKKIYKIVE